jgi:hypothetical protein
VDLRAQSRRAVGLTVPMPILVRVLRPFLMAKAVSPVLTILYLQIVLVIPDV